MNYATTATITIICLLLAIYILGMFMPVGKYLDMFFNRFFGWIRSTLPDGFNGEDKEEEEIGPQTHKETIDEHFENVRDAKEVDSQTSQKPEETGTAGHQTETTTKNRKEMIEPIKQRCIDTLHKLGCTIKDTRDDWTIFTFQGEHFAMLTEEDSLWAHLIDCPWFDVPLDDIDEVALVRKVVNEVNRQTSLKLVYTIDKEDNKLNLETRHDFVVFPEIIDLESYFTAILNSFFLTKHDFIILLDKERLAANAQQ